jgi:hypothetical protein
LVWVQTGNYLEILDGDYKTSALVAIKACPQCSKSNKVDAMICTHCGYQLIAEPTGAEAEEAARKAAEAAGGETTDPISKAWGDVRGWYKRKFTTEGPWDQADEGAIDSSAEKKNGDDNKPPQ